MSAPGEEREVDRYELCERVVLRPPEWWWEEDEEDPSLTCALCCCIGDECCLGEDVWDRPICHRCAAPMVGEDD